MFRADVQLYLKFKLCDQKDLFVPCDNVIFSRVASLVPGFRDGGVILNLSPVKKWRQ